MKIAVCSDLHLEFAPLTIENPGDVEVLILSGDILVERDLEIYDRRQIELGFMGKRSLQWQTFFEQVCAAFPHVLYVAGNHEHYHGDFATTLSGLKTKLAAHKNLHVLDKEVFRLRGADEQDYLFIGSTLWTDMNKGDPLTLHAISTMMNDFRIVENSNRQVSYKTFEVTEEGRQIPTFRTRTAKFCPEDAMEEHKKCLDYIKFMVAESAPWETIIVVGHHTPSYQSCHPRYASDDLMNGGYHSDLSEFILDHPQIKLWTHGHTHELYDYMIGGTRIVCNPRGYDGYEPIAETFKLKVVEL